MMPWSIRIEPVLSNGPKVAWFGRVFSAVLREEAA